jgi:manganese oxidase
MGATTMSGAARLWAAIAATAILLLALTVGLTYAGAFGARDPAGAAEAVATDEVTVQVELSEFALSPADLVVPADTPIVFELTNTGTVPHDFVIDGVAASEVLAGGASGTLRVDGIPAGEYRTLCNEAGHDAAGMVGTLTATADGTAGDEPEEAAHAAHGDMTAAEMAAAMEDLRGFPAETEGRGNQPLEPTMDGDVKVFELTASELDWEVEPGVTRPAMAFNEQIPGPRIDVDLGDRVRIVLHNEMSMPTALHLHGLVLPNDQDGVPGITQPSIMPGESFAYELTVRNAGSHMYHSHFDAAEQVPGGLLGAFIVHGPDEPEVDHDLVMILNDGPLGYTLNGKGFPATEPLVMQQGETARVRYMNEGLQIHPMHTHGMAQRVIAKDGYPLPAPHLEDNVLVSPGDRVDVIIEPEEPGVWAWHCHILTHAETPEGMFGMVTAIVVE